MPRRRREQRLERVLGAPALFATAYGNVGSSIYYALGVTAVFALGLTPVVFLIAGLIFAATAATYAEGTVRYPEAGGSSSFARHAFNELVSFGAAWAQMLNYIITIAISAFFVPHYLSIFWAAAAGEPVGRRRRRDRDRAPGRVEHRRSPGGGEPQRLPRGDRLRHAAAARRCSASCLVFSPAIAGRQRPLRRGADLERLLPRDPDRDDRLHRDRDRLEPGRGGARSCRATSRVRILLVAVAVFAIYFTLPADRPLGAAGHARSDGEYETLLGLPPEEGGFANDPVLGRRREPRHLAASLLDSARDLRGRPRRDDPPHRHERGRDRRLAHHVFDVELPPAAERFPPAPPAVQDAVDRAGRLRRASSRSSRPCCPGRRLPGDDVLVRRDAVVHDRPRSP